MELPEVEGKFRLGLLHDLRITRRDRGSPTSAHNLRRTLKNVGSRIATSTPTVPIHVASRSCTRARGVYVTVTVDSAAKRLPSRA